MTDHESAVRDALKTLLDARRSMGSEDVRDVIVDFRDARADEMGQDASNDEDILLGEIAAAFSSVSDYEQGCDRMVRVADFTRGFSAHFQSRGGEQGEYLTSALTAVRRTLGGAK